MKKVDCSAALQVPDLYIVDLTVLNNSVTVVLKRYSCYDRSGQGG